MVTSVQHEQVVRIRWIRTALISEVPDSGEVAASDHVDGIEPERRDEKRHDQTDCDGTKGNASPKAVARQAWTGRQDREPRKPEQDRTEDPLLPIRVDCDEEQTDCWTTGEGPISCLASVADQRHRGQCADDQNAGEERHHRGPHDRQPLQDRRGDGRRRPEVLDTTERIERQKAVHVSPVQQGPPYGGSQDQQRRPPWSNQPEPRQYEEGTAHDIGLSLIHISEPTRRTPISYAVFCLKKK